MTFRDVEISIPKIVHQNGSLFIHTFLVPSKNIENKSALSMAKLSSFNDVTYVKGNLKFVLHKDPVLSKKNYNKAI